MKTAIIYYSKHGTTERVTHLIGEKLTNKVDYISLKECPRPDIRTYDRIILGTAIYAGSPNRKVTQFCHNNQPLLEQKVIGLFICCMNEEQEAEEMNKAFPEFLQRLSIPKAILGGEFQFDKMNFIERFLTKKIAKINSSVSKLRYDAINEFTIQIKDYHYGNLQSNLLCNLLSNLFSNRYLYAYNKKAKYLNQELESESK